MTKEQKMETIKQLQTNLNAAGAKPKLVVDGVFGPKTQAALEASLKTEVPRGVGKMHPIDLLRTLLGTKEIVGKLHNPQIQEFLESCDNIGGRKDKKLHADEVPWCSAIINWLAEQCDMEKTNNALAASWDRYNEDTGEWVEEGDIVTLAQPGRHVTLANKRFNKKTAKTFEGLGGNQGNAIKVSTYSVSKIKATRKWKPLPGKQVPKVKSSGGGSTGNGDKESTR